tara:strand:- start:1716 stop:3641 length:1926 start_codon:yes stop_codon:yes gene_type:complete
MCGFTVFYNKSLNSKKNINKLFSYIENRGPDNQKILKCNNITFLFARLSIQDLTSKGNQPIFSSSKNFLMVFNGEIYNHIELRKEILNLYPKKKWKGHSDTETLIESFELLGIDKTLKIISGMYSIFLFNLKNKEFYMINDIFGEKPMYYEIRDNCFIVSSSLNSFLLEKRNINFTNSTNLFFKNYIPHEKTSIENVYKIKPGTILKYKILTSRIKKIYKRKYFSIKKPNSFLKNQSLDSISLSLEKKMLEAVEEQLISDVPIGSFLSGGIDSSLITSLMNKVSKKKISTFTIGFNNKQFNEAEYAKDISNYLGTKHHEQYLSNKNLFKIFDDVLDAYHEPFSDSSQLPTTLLCKFASKKIKVCLTGDGGDELFGGYNRYIFNKKLWNIYRLIPSLAKSFIYSLSNNKNKILISMIKNSLKIYEKRFVKMNYLDQKIITMLRSIKSDSLGSLTQILSSHISMEDINNLFVKDTKFTIPKKNIFETEDLMFDDLNNYLPGDLLVKVDRASMHYGLETRMPFLNKKVYEYARKIPIKYKVSKKESKIIIKNILYKYIPKKFLERPKQGFLIPINELLNDKSTIRKIDDILNKKKLKNQNLFNVDEIDSLWKRYKSGYTYDQYLIWDIIMFQSWVDKNISSLNI